MNLVTGFLALATATLLASVALPLFATAAMIMVGVTAAGLWMCLVYGLLRRFSSHRDHPGERRRLANASHQRGS